MSPVQGPSSYDNPFYQPDTDPVNPSPPRSLSPEYWPQTTESEIEEEDFIEVKRVDNVVVLEVLQPLNPTYGTGAVIPLAMQWIQ